MKKFITLFFVSVLLLIFPLTGVYGQSIHPTQVTKAVHFDKSQPLRDVTPIPLGQRERTWKNKVVPNVFDFAKFNMKASWHKGADPVLQKVQGHPMSTDAVIDVNVAGIANTYGIAPPDTDGDVGPNEFFQMVNNGFAIYNKSGVKIYGPADNITLWNGFPGPWSSTNDGDPVVLYDEYSDRWISTQFSLPYYPNGPFYELVAVSETGDPTGSWYRYAFQFDNMPDYPKFGVWTNGYYFTSNQFDHGNWQGGAISILDRDAMLIGDPDAEMLFFEMGSSNGSILPADADGILPPPTGEPCYFVSLAGASLKMWSADVDWNTPANTTIDYLGYIPVEAYSDNNISISQPGTSQKLDDLAGRLMYRLQYRNFGDYEVLLTNHTVNANGAGQAGVRWYELRKYGSADWELYQQGTFAPSDGASRWMASAAMNDLGDIAIGYSVSSTAVYPSIRIVGQSAGAPLGLGVLDIDEISIKEGTKSQTGVNRWGDYSAMSVDPSDGITFWYTQQYSNGGWNWRSQIAAVNFAQAPAPDFSADNVLIPVGETVNFFDQSLNLPTEWAWSFEGGDPATSTDQNPTSILYSTEGSFTVELTASNDIGSNTVIKEAYITTSSVILPEVDFDISAVDGCTSDTITFTDLTQYVPRQWNWEFTPSTVTFVNGTDASSQNPQVVFDQGGVYSVKLTATNLNGSSFLEKPDLFTAGGLVPYFIETFEDGLLQNDWTIEKAASEFTWGIQEIGGTEPGNQAAGILLRDKPAGERDRLISPAFNLEGMSNASLEFQYAYAQRNDRLYDSLIVYISVDCGSNWTRIFAGGENGSGNFATHELTSDFWPEIADDWCISGWGAQCININLTDWVGNSDVKLAFESYSDLGNPLFIDNIAVSQYLSVNDLASNAIKVYPNPTNGSLQVIFGDTQYAQIQLLNQFGQVIYQVNSDKKASSVIIPDLGLNSGIYFVVARGAKGLSTVKVIAY
ncbi:MAG: PKD domain-containing protein [Bacteroidales bacterium]|nr:PKD domain-containing protein [Bacteroidales bacterium]